MRASVSSHRDPNCLPIYIPIKNDIRITYQLNNLNSLRELWAPEVIYLNLIGSLCILVIL